jgi:hypothetical protein
MKDSFSGGQFTISCFPSKKWLGVIFSTVKLCENPLSSSTVFDGPPSPLGKAWVAVKKLLSDVLFSPCPSQELSKKNAPTKS